MQSLILRAFARILLSVMFAVSLFVLYRGHNEPGGGFVGGLIAASGFAIVALAEGVTATRMLLYVRPPAFMGLGLVCAIASGLPGLVRTDSFLAHRWVQAAGLAIGTPLVFDLGVYLVVLGGVLSLILRFYEEH